MIFYVQYTTNIVHMQLPHRPETTVSRNSFFISILYTKKLRLQIHAERERQFFIPYFYFRPVYRQ